jgi:hypothetical protein
MSNSLIYVHGIRVRKAKYVDLADRLSGRLKELREQDYLWHRQRAIKVVRSPVGFVPSLNPFLESCRMKNERKYREALTQALEEVSNAPLQVHETNDVAILAHSYGTLNIGRIANESLAELHPGGSNISRIILMGSILKREFNWTRCGNKNTGLQHVWNIAKPLDFIVGLSSFGKHWYGRDTGYSGLLGFCKMKILTNHFATLSDARRHGIVENDFYTIMSILKRRRTFKIRSWEDYKSDLQYSWVDRWRLRRFLRQNAIYYYD